MLFRRLPRGEMPGCFGQDAVADVVPDTRNEQQGDEDQAEYVEVSHD